MKRVIKDSVETLDLSKVTSGHIYAIVRNGIVYKAHSFQDNRWGFVSIEDSISIWVSDNNLNDIIEGETGQGVFEFESSSEFCKWILK